MVRWRGMRAFSYGNLVRLGLAGYVAVAVAACPSQSRRAASGPDASSTPPAASAHGTRLQHGETLRWVAEHRAWRMARKTRPIWARPVRAEEIGREFVTADHVVERAAADHWLCVGVAGEPWFQTRAKIESKYERAGSEERRFAFDDATHVYERFVPLSTSRNWAAKVTGPGIEGFYIQPNYPTDGPLYSPAGGWVVMDYVDDPYGADPTDVWLVQEALFESTYEVTQ